MIRFISSLLSKIKARRYKTKYEHAMVELQMLRDAVIDLGEQLEEAEAKIAEYEAQLNIDTSID